VRPPVEEPIVDEEENDGKTMPAYDVEDYERERAARAAARAESEGDSAGKANDDEDRTTAGVSPPLPPARPAKGPSSPSGQAGASPPLPSKRRDEGDARAAELLGKIDAMAMADDIATKTSMPAVQPRTDERSTDTKWDGPTQHQPSGGRSGAGPSTSPELRALAPKESMIVGPNGRIEGNAGIRPPLQGGSAQPGRPMNPTLPLIVDGDDGATSDTPPPSSTMSTSIAGATEKAPRAPVQRARPQKPQVQTQKLPPVFYAAVAAIIGLVMLSAVGLVVLLFAFRGGADQIDYGIAVVNTEPKGAHVFIDGEDVGESPIPAAVPKDREFAVLVTLDGYKAAEEKTYKLDGKEKIELPVILLEKK
jgi:hypothetical protein